MEHEGAPGKSCSDRASDELSQLWMLEQKRRYIREYMRRWRSRADHQTLEHENRRRSYRQRKLAGTAGALRSAENTASPVCAICRKRPSITTVMRLRLLDKAPYNYAEMLVPYCGKC